LTFHALSVCRITLVYSNGDSTTDRLTLAHSADANTSGRGNHPSAIWVCQNPSLSWAEKYV
jgi:hypothetical protein